MEVHHGAFSVHHTFRSILGPFLVDTELIHSFENASSTYMLATHIHVHELQIANSLERPMGV